MDFHAHWLYGLDDGAKTPAETLKLLEVFSGLGYRQIIASPHISDSLYENTPSGILQRLNDVRDLARENHIGLELYATAEYLIDSAFPTHLEHRNLMALNHKYLLVELSYLSPPLHLRQVIFDIQLAGFTPILAHPERYPYYFKSMGDLENLKNSGCLLQLNMLSGVGYYGPEVAAAAEEMLKRNWIDFACTDMHHQRHVEAFSEPVKIKSYEKLAQAVANNTAVAY